MSPVAADRADYVSLLEDQLREKGIALEKAMREKEELLTTLAHELRNPLAPIAYAAAMIRAGAAAETLAHSREIIERQVRTLAALLEAFLDDGAIDAGLASRVNELRTGTGPRS